MRKMSRGLTSLDVKGQVPSTTRLRMQLTSNSKGYMELNLNGRDMRTVPAETFQLTTTQVLRLAHNHIDYLPLMISYLRALKVLDLQHNLLVHLPETLVNCRHLAELSLAANRLSSLPKGIGALKHLKVLSLGNNQFEHLPEEVGLLTSLRILDIHGNKLWHLPFSLQELHHLYDLNASDNMFDNVPLVITKITSLQKLNLSRNRLAALPVDFDALKNLRELNLSQNSFVSISSLLVALKHLRYLSLAHNRLKFLPPQLSRLQNLRVLHLQHNDLTRAPTRMTSVQYYNVATNNLTSFSVESMRGLISLTASSNNIETVPQGLYKLKKLKFLYLNNNRLVELEEDIGLLQQLRVLDISNNKLISVPNSLYRLAKLQSFNVKGNITLNRTGVKKEDDEMDKTELSSLGKKKQKKDDLIQPKDEREHSPDSVLRFENKGNKTVTDAKEGFNFDKNYGGIEGKTRKSEAGTFDSKCGYLKNVDTLSDWELRANEDDDNYCQHHKSIKSPKIDLLDSSSGSSLRKNKLMFRKSSFSEQEEHIPRKKHSIKGFKEFFLGKSKREVRTDVAEASRFSPKNSGRIFQFNYSSHPDQVMRRDKEKRISPMTGHSEMAKISSIRRKDETLEKAHDGDWSITREHRPRLTNKTQFITQSGGRQHDEDSKSDSHGYGSWRSRGRPQLEDFDTDNNLENSTEKYSHFNEKSQHYQCDDVNEQKNNYFAHINNGQNRHSFMSKAAASKLHEKQNYRRYHEFPKNSRAEKFNPANADSDFLVDRYDNSGSSYSKFNNRGIYRVKNYESEDERSIVYNEFNSSPRYRPSQGNDFFNVDARSKGKFSQTVEVDQTRAESMSKLQFQHEDVLHEEWSKRNTPKDIISGQSTWPYTTEHDYIPEYVVHYQHRNTGDCPAATFDAMLKNTPVKYDCYSYDSNHKVSNRFYPRNQSFSSNQPNERELFQRYKTNPERNIEFNAVKKNVTQHDDIYIQDKENPIRIHHTRNLSEHGDDTIFKSKQMYPEFHHILSTSDIQNNELHLKTFVENGNSGNKNVHNKPPSSDKLNGRKVNTGLTRSRSVDSMIVTPRKCASCCRHVNDKKDHETNIRLCAELQVSDKVRESSEGDASQGERNERGRTDFSLLGVCNQVETFLHKGLLQPVIAFSHLGNYRDNKIKDSSNDEAGSHCLVYSQPQTFTFSRDGGEFVSNDGSRVQVVIPALAVDKSISITIQLMTISPAVISRVKELNYFVENILAIGPVVFFKVHDEPALNSPATITIPAPAEVKGGHLVVLTVRRDNSCVPCSDGFRSKKMAATFTTWHFTGKVALITRAKCKYKACKSVELLLQCVGVKQDFVQ